MLTERCITTQTISKMDPKWTQNGPKMDPKWTQNGPKMDPKWTQNGPKMDPKWTQNGPKMDPKWTQNGPKMDTELDTHINAFGAWHTYKRGSPEFSLCFLWQERQWRRMCGKCQSHLHTCKEVWYWTVVIYWSRFRKEVVFYGRE